MISRIFTLVFKNANLRYLVTRYLVYFIQFLSSIFLATKLGSYFFGVWGSILLIINYFAVVDFGFANAMNILIIKHRDDKAVVAKLMSNSLLLVSILNGIILILPFYYQKIGLGGFLHKFEIEKYFLVICVVGIITNYNNIFMQLYRIYNKLTYISLYQSLIPIAVFGVIFFFSEVALLNVLVVVYLCSSVLSLLIFMAKNPVRILGNLDRQLLRLILRKGFFLFLYNVSFYLILLSLRTIISANYSVDDFGIFTFSFALANSILLFLQALSFLLFPKLIALLGTADIYIVRKTLTNLRGVYLPLVYLFIFIALFLFPYFLNFLPNYSTAFKTLGLSALTVVLYTNSFGYGTYMLANGHERINAYIAIICLICNIALGLILVNVFHVSYAYVLFATVFAYLLYSYLCVRAALRKLDQKYTFFGQFNESFDFRLLVPYVAALVLILCDFPHLMFVPLCIFVILNRNNLTSVIKTIKRIATNPDVLNV